MRVTTNKRRISTDSEFSAVRPDQDFNFTSAIQGLVNTTTSSNFSDSRSVSSDEGRMHHESSPQAREQRQHVAIRIKKRPAIYQSQLRRLVSKDAIRKKKQAKMMRQRNSTNCAAKVLTRKERGRQDTRKKVGVVENKLMKPRNSSIVSQRNGKKQQYVRALINSRSGSKKPQYQLSKNQINENLTNLIDCWHSETRNEEISEQPPPPSYQGSPFRQPMSKKQKQKTFSPQTSKLHMGNTRGHSYKFSFTLKNANANPRARRSQHIEQPLLTRPPKYPGLLPVIRQ